jgi:hypothetical protein
MSVGLAALTETIHVAQAYDTSLAISVASYAQHQMVCTHKGLLQPSSHIVWQTFPRDALYTDIGRQDVAICNYRVHVVRVIDRICFSAAVEHGTGKRGIQDTELQDTEPKHCHNTDQNT